MGSYNDRVEGVLLATAAGDALGAPYEFKPPRGPEQEVAMTGGGGWESGEWTDDTSMAIAIAEVAATGADLRDEAAQDEIVQRWYEWSRHAKDVGIQTRLVLSSAASGGFINAASARVRSVRLHEQTGRTAGNGSLMRTAPVALAYLDDEDALVEATRAISELTHFDPDAGDACVLWCCAIRHAVLTGELEVRIGLQHIASERQPLWTKRLDAAEAAPPASFPNNGWVVTALQAAWSAITTTPVPADDGHTGVFRADHLRHALDAAVRAGYGTRRHGGGDRRRSARRGARRIGGTRRMAHGAARLARDQRPRSRQPCGGNSAKGPTGQVRLLTPGLTHRHVRTSSVRQRCPAGWYRGTATSARRSRRHRVTVPACGQGHAPRYAARGGEAHRPGGA